MKMIVSAQTHPGYVRTNNEDAHLLLPGRDLLVVADGMAGHRFGELASALAVKTMKRFFLSDELENLLADQLTRAKKAERELPELTVPYYKLRRALEECNTAIFDTTRKNPRYETMGTTIVATVLVGDNLYVGHVGDSRVYRVRDGELEQLTSDHSLLNEYLSKGFISQDEVETFPLKNVIVKALGLQEDLEVAVAERSARPGDYLLLCTDGLTDLVQDALIESAFLVAPSPAQAASELVRMALEAGGADNITVVVALIEK